MSSPHAVVCALEDTLVSRHALRASRWLARELDAPVVAVHVFDPMAIGVPPSGEMLAAGIADDQLERAARGAALRLVDETAREAGLEAELVEGRPVTELLRRAGALRARLLVTGTATRTGLERLLIGSVASELAARAPCPVVTVTRGAALEVEGPVLAGFDGSEHSLRAARHAAALAARLKRRLVLLHVADGDERVDVDPRLADELAAGARRALGEGDRPSLALQVSVALEEGDAVTLLSQVARELSAALIVTGTRGRSGVRAALLGSVSSGLTRAAGRPVVVVPASAG